MEQQFSIWKKWNNRAILEGICYPGVYILSYTEEEDLSETIFSWREEIIYIGMTNARSGLKCRLQQFENSIAGKTGHGGAERVRYKHRDYTLFTSNLYASIHYAKCNVQSNQPDDLIKMGEIAKLEYLCFAEYVKRFGRLPEFNDKKRSPKYHRTKRYDLNKIT